MPTDQRIKHVDVLIIGNGPAGALTAAYAALRMKRRVHIVAPSSSHCTYCAWVEALEGTWLNEAFPRDLFKYRWPRVEFKGGKKGIQDKSPEKTILDRAYGMVDWDRIHAWAMSQESVTWTKKRMVQSFKTHAIDESGVKYVANCIIDASGHDSKFTRYEKDNVMKRFQSFYGEEIQHNHGIQTAQLMNWELPFNDLGPPSFVYVLPLSKDCIFLEETVLISERPVSRARMKARLQERKENLGIPATAEVRFTEAYDLPMGGGVAVKR